MSSEPRSLCPWCRGPQHTGNCDREALKEQIRLLRLEAAAREKLPGKNVIMITSLISHRNRKPRIDIQLGELHTQMDTDAAVKIARDILEVAAGAYADAFLFHFLTGKLDQPDGVAAQIIPEFRQYRDELRREFDAMQKKEGLEE
jgi:hypothetical protein